MNTTTVEVRPRTSAGTHVRRTLPDATRAVMRLLGTDHRRCWCLRCLLTRTGLVPPGADAERSGNRDRDASARHAHPPQVTPLGN